MTSNRNSTSWLWQINLKELLLLVAVAAVALGWWVDRRCLRSQLELRQARLDEMNCTLTSLYLFVHMNPQPEMHEVIGFVDSRTVRRGN